MGSGLIVARLPDGSWSAPSAIGMVGMGIGGQIGGEITDFIFVLNTEEALRAFSRGTVTLGGNLSVAAGPIGRNAEASKTFKNFASIYSYSKTKGLFAGVSLEGAVIVTRKSTNCKLYGPNVGVEDILGGFISPPLCAHSLYSVLELVAS